MEISASRLVLCGGLFIISALSGVWVSSLGRPLNTPVVTLHKLVSLAAVIVIGLTAFRLARSGGLSGAPVIIALAAGGLLFLALFASGALLSFDRPVPLVALRVHQVAPLLALLAWAAAFYLSGAAVRAGGSFF